MSVTRRRNILCLERKKIEKTFHIKYANVLYLLLSEGESNLRMYAVVNRMIHLALRIFPINFHHDTKLNLKYVMSWFYSVYLMLNIIKEY